MRSRLTRLLTVALAGALVAALSATPAVAHGKQNPNDKVVLWLTVLHNNDGESQIIDAGSGLEDFGGVARFKTVVDNLKQEALYGPLSEEQKDACLKKRHRWGWSRLQCYQGVVMLSSGDNFLAGPEFNASLNDGLFYDAIAISEIGYDAIALGNHDFDFGPELLADFIGEVDSDVPYLSANLDFSAEPDLWQLVRDRRIVKSTIVREGGFRIGIIGATTENLSFISSPRNVIINEVLPAVQREIKRLERRHVTKIILISHLQSIDEEIALLSQLKDVDVVIAGGGDELLANPGDLLVPGDEGSVFGPYPILAPDKRGWMVPVVTTPGEYKYVGRLVVGFNWKGRVVAVASDSGVVRVAASGEEGGVEPDSFVQENVVDPVAASIADLAANVIAASEVALEGRRAPGVRTQETNLGNLCGDSQLWQATELAASFGQPVPDVALQNGGGIRNNTLIPAGDFTELNTFEILPFANFIVIVPDIPRDQFKEILENAVSRVEFSDGRFAQIAGFSFVYDPAGIPQELNPDGTVATAGSRVIDVTLDSGAQIVMGGVVQAGDPINVATIDFLANGGDQYPYRGAPFTRLGVTYQQALENFVVEGLAGFILAAEYPEGGSGRITTVP